MGQWTVNISKWVLNGYWMVFFLPVWPWFDHPFLVETKNVKALSPKVYVLHTRFSIQSLLAGPQRKHPVWTIAKVCTGWLVPVLELNPFPLHWGYSPLKLVFELARSSKNESNVLVSRSLCCVRHCCHLCVVVLAWFEFPGSKASNVWKQSVS